MLNSSLNVAQFWDGARGQPQRTSRRPHRQPGGNGLHRTTWPWTCCNSIPGYLAEFKQVFGKTSINIDQVTAAIAAFEETLVTPNSRFDKWLKGDQKALTKQELEGYQLFQDSGCVACHNGAAVGGNSFQRMGLVEA